jgi:hypothetical protein
VIVSLRRFSLATALHLQLDVFVTQQHSLRPLPALDGRLTQLWALSPHALAYTDMAPDQQSVAWAWLLLDVFQTSINFASESMIP